MSISTRKKEVSFITNLLYKKGTTPFTFIYFKTIRHKLKLRYTQWMRSIDTLSSGVLLPSGVSKYLAGQGLTDRK
jgi:hypothetical protein